MLGQDLLRHGLRLLDLCANKRDLRAPPPVRVRRGSLGGLLLARAVSPQCFFSGVTTATASCWPLVRACVLACRPLHDDLCRPPPRPPRACSSMRRRQMASRPLTEPVLAGVLAGVGGAAMANTRTAVRLEARAPAHGSGGAAKCLQSRQHGAPSFGPPAGSKLLPHASQSRQQACCLTCGMRCAALHRGCHLCKSPCPMQRCDYCHNSG